MRERVEHVLGSARPFLAASIVLLPILAIGQGRVTREQTDSVYRYRLDTALAARSVKYVEMDSAAKQRIRDSLERHFRSEAVNWTYYRLIEMRDSARKTAPAVGEEAFSTRQRKILEEWFPDSAKERVRRDAELMVTRIHREIHQQRLLSISKRLSGIADIDTLRDLNDEDREFLRREYRRSHPVKQRSR